MNNDDNNGWTAPPGELSSDRYNECYYRAAKKPTWAEMMKFYETWRVSNDDPRH